MVGNEKFICKICGGELKVEDIKEYINKPKWLLPISVFWLILLLSMDIITMIFCGSIFCWLIFIEKYYYSCPNDRFHKFSRFKVEKTKKI